MTPRIGRLPKAITLVPLAALSVVCTVNVMRAPAPDVTASIGEASGPAATTPTTTAPSTSAPGALVVPPGTQAPASVWGGPQKSPAVAAAPAVVSTTAIPSVALAAYQRAATVIDTADRACHLDWSLLAGIGRVESNHGGGRLTVAGVATPGVVGPALTGLGGTLLVSDTDAGSLDGDTRFDHAVGPMQFLPSTWSTVGVDADGDGQRNPQDVDDAALAAAVYLCSGPEDLATDAGRRAALLRYNHSSSYVATVLSAATQYRSGTGLGGGLGGSYVNARALPFIPGAAGTTGAAGTPGTPGSPQPSTTGGPKKHRHSAVATLSAPAAPSSHPVKDPAPPHPVKDPGHPSPTPTPDPTPDPTPAPTAATDDELEALCGPEIEETYAAAAADPDLLVRAVDACVAGLKAADDDVLTLGEAKALLVEVVTDLVKTVPELAPTTPPTTPPTDGTTEPPAPGGTTEPPAPGGTATGTTTDPSPSAPTATATP